jgi:hypothetical protein
MDDPLLDIEFGLIPRRRQHMVSSCGAVCAALCLLAGFVPLFRSPSPDVVRATNVAFVGAGALWVASFGTLLHWVHRLRSTGVPTLAVNDPGPALRRQTGCGAAACIMVRLVAGIVLVGAAALALIRSERVVENAHFFSGLCILHAGNIIGTIQVHAATASLKCCSVCKHDSLPVVSSWVALVGSTSLVGSCGVILFSLQDAVGIGLGSTLVFVGVISGASALLFASVLDVFWAILLCY